MVLIKQIQEIDKNNGIDKVESANIWQNTKKCYYWLIKFNNNCYNIIHMRILFEVKNHRNSNNS